MPASGKLLATPVPPYAGKPHERALKNTMAIRAYLCYPWQKSLAEASITVLTALPAKYSRESRSIGKEEREVKNPCISVLSSCQQVRGPLFAAGKIYPAKLLRLYDN